MDLAKSELELLEGRARKAEEALVEARRKLEEAAPKRKATQDLIKKKQVRSRGQGERGCLGCVLGEGASCVLLSLCFAGWCRVCVC